MKSASRKTTTAPDSYFDLVRRSPLRKIGTAREHAEALRLVRELTRKGDEKLDEGEVDYLAALAHFVSAYERNKYRVALPRPSPLQMLKHFMGERGMAAADLGRVIGSASAASMVLRGQRELSKSQIRTVAEHFNVDPGLFL
jgi:antitoxin component HigA of HigAB toxin-antitoxin module